MAEFDRVNAQEKVVHDRVADEDHLVNRARVNLGLVGNRRGQRIDRLAHGAGHLDIAAGVHHGIADAAHQIFAKADLRVHQAR